MTLLAAQAAVAIENARLYESATRWSRAARVVDRGRQRARRPRLELRPTARPRRAPAARADRRPARPDRASEPERRPPDRGGGRARPEEPRAGQTSPRAGRRSAACSSAAGASAWTRRWTTSRSTRRWPRAHRRCDRASTCRCSRATARSACIAAHDKLGSRCPLQRRGSSAGRDLRRRAPPSPSSSPNGSRAMRCGE